jgi:rhamnosyltransferase
MRFGLLVADHAVPVDIAAIVVLYNPPDDMLDRLARIAATADKLIVVVNGASDGLISAIATMSEVRLILNDKNRGLGEAMNQGLADAFTEIDAHFALLFDQDSLPEPGLGRTLRAAFCKAELDGARPAAMGARLIDVKGTNAHVGRQIRSAGPIVAVPTLATSGTLLSRNAYHRVGPMRADLFVDCIDHEWCFRAAAAGLTSYVVADCTMQHDMGEDGFVFLGRYRPIHRSPFRHYFITRNSLWLVRQRHVPLAWRLREAAKIGPRMLAYCYFSRDRSATIGALSQAIWDGIASKLGELRQPMRVRT